jgi:hypothetical protein
VSDPWQWAEPIRERHFGEPLLGRYRLERVAEGRSWGELVPAWRGSWPPEVYFDFERLRSQAGRDTAERLSASRGAVPLREHWRVMDGDRQVALFTGGQYDDRTYLMGHAQVHPDEQRKGIYSAIVRLIVAYTGELGFDQVISTHSPSNNAVLIPKLRAGFVITALEIDAAFGMSIRLTYFHVPEQLDAFRFRAGDASLSAELIESGFGGMDDLRKQFADGET